MPSEPNLHDDLPAESPVAEVGDPNRWIALGLCAAYSCTNAIQWVTYAPVADSSKEYFNLNTFQLNMLSTVYMIVFVIGAVFTCSTFERWGVRRAVLIGSGLNALGSILKFFLGIEVPCYTTVIIAQTVNAFAQLFVLSTPPLIAAQYFPANTRAFATAVAATANTVGYAAWLVVPPLIVTSASKSQFQILFGIQMGMCSAVFLGVIFFLKPPQYLPPSTELLDAKRSTTNGNESGQLKEVEGAVEMSSYTYTASSPTKSNVQKCVLSNTEEVKSVHLSRWDRFMANQQVVILIQVFQTCALLVRNRDFCLLLCSFSIGTGTIWAFFGVLAQISDPVGVSELLAGISGSGSVVFATILAYLVGLWVDRTHRYKLPVVLCFGGSVIGWLALMFSMMKAPKNSTTMDILCVSTFMFSGLFQNTAIPICFEFALEITYPLQESVPGALLMAGANLVSLCLMFICSALLGNDTATRSASVKCVGIFVGLCAVGTILAIFPREKLARLEAERRGRTMHSESKEANLRLPQDYPSGNFDDQWVDDEGVPKVLQQSPTSPLEEALV